MDKYVGYVAAYQNIIVFAVQYLQHITNCTTFTTTQTREEEQASHVGILIT